MDLKKTPLGCFFQFVTKGSGFLKTAGIFFEGL